MALPYDIMKMSNKLKKQHRRYYSNLKTSTSRVKTIRRRRRRKGRRKEEEEEVQTRHKYEKRHNLAQ